MRHAALSLLAALAVTPAFADYPVTPVPFTATRITGGFWKPRQDINRDVTLPYAFQQCESTNRVKNFDLAAEVMRRRAHGEPGFQLKPQSMYPFDDSDVYKDIEGASYILGQKADPELDRKLDALIARIAAAQEPDGYLYTWRTMHPDSPVHEWIDARRWLKDPELSHELYDLGHLYEAGTAHFLATGKRTLLDVCLRSAELLYRDFGQNRLKIAPGHQVVEMGLVKLYRVTGDRRWLELARYFLDVRGPGGDPYNQLHQRVVDQREAVGHAVRATYMYSGMADVAALTGDKAYLQAITRIWDDVAGSKLYLTGGIGARSAGEAFGDPFELPQRGYNETCAAVGNIMWNHRMFLMTSEAKYLDVLERTLYNGFLSGVSLSGDRFFYPNPLVCDGKTRFNMGYPTRAPWFGCACCPPNVLRTLASLSGYAYAVRNDQIFVGLYLQNRAEVPVKGHGVTLTQTTDYPWNGAVRIEVDPGRTRAFSLNLRIPGWAQGHPVPSALYAYRNAGPAAWSLKVNGRTLHPRVENGFAVVDRTWKKGDIIALDLPMPVHEVTGDARISATRGRVAFERGPLVYCIEGPDNGGDVLDAALPGPFRISTLARPDLLGGLTALRIEGARRVTRDVAGATVTTPATLTAIPYFAWANRGPAQMQVWLPLAEKDVPLPPRPTLAARSKVAVSFAREGMETVALNDQLAPENATDGFAPHFDFWPHLGTLEWAEYRFPQPARVGRVEVTWFEDQSAGGACATPASWRVLFLAPDGSWQPVQGASPCGTAPKARNTTTFEPVTTTALRLEIQLRPEASAGIFEWAVE